MTRFQDYADWILKTLGFFTLWADRHLCVRSSENDPLSRAVLGEHSLEDGIDGSWD